jgi:3-oxoacyl-[acyl-carrier-protein] synthase-3
VLFGDGAGAALLERAHEPGVIDSVTGMDGTMAEQITVPGGGSAEPVSPESLAANRMTVHMPDGQTVFRRAVEHMADACGTLLAKSGFSPSDVDAVVAHQANARIIRAVAHRLGLAEAVAWVDVAEVGNTSAGSIPLALDRGWQRNRLHPGDLVLTTAFGAGFTWGANLMRWTAFPPGDHDGPSTSSPAA